MLILTRAVNQKIVIGDSVSVMVVEIRSDVVRLGIDAPTEVDIHREEVHREILRLRAAGIDPSEDQARRRLEREQRRRLRREVGMTP